MDTKELLIFLVIGFGWIVFSQITFKYIRRFLSRSPEDKKKELTFKSLIFDFIFLCLGFYAFYNKFWHEINSELKGKIVAIVLINLIYFGFFIVWGYLGLHKYFRYGIIMLILYIIIIFGIITLVLNKSQLSSFLNQIWEIYNWFFLVLFPTEIGNLMRKLRLYIKLRNSRDMG
jgi:hypothetical protein